MLKVVVLVSGGGTNLQAILDAVDSGAITNTEIVGVISNNKNAYALQRAEEKGIPDVCVSPKAFASRAEFNQALLDTVDQFQADLLVLAGIFGCHSGNDDRSLQKPYYQYPSIFDSGILRNWVLWFESA